VYRARVCKLNRDVALKILPDAFASEPERLVRFQREAHWLTLVHEGGVRSHLRLEASFLTKVRTAYDSRW
jgi:serine/threonine-protein kinase